MPKISKARIVNFSYNDGNRLIADELYDFSSENEEDALNVLINLANGGGKSVLVQLLMQPIIPRAKVAGRKIESFFGKLTDHCYVVLEWIKDGSPERLLTGISIAARELAPAEDEHSRGMGIRYYTFYAEYRSENAACSIANLPLSKRQNGLFVPADYDGIRNLCRKNQSGLHWYSSDDNPQWKRKLEEYQIHQTEWRTIEKLNSEEGGLSKFFGAFKTSDQLIDHLLIPTIEGKLQTLSSGEDSSLVTMLLSHVRSFAAQKQKLEKKMAYEVFWKDLGILKPMAEKLWTLDDAQKESLSRLWGLKTAVQNQMEQFQFRQKQEKQRLQELEKTLYHIRWEQASRTYYEKQAEYESAASALKTAQLQQRELEQLLNGIRHEIAAMECAGYLEQLRACQSEAAQLLDAIRQRQAGTEESREITVLGASAACAIRSELELVRPDLEQKQAACTELEGQISEIQKTLNKQTAEARAACSAYDQSKGKLDGAEGETDQEVARLPVEICRRLDRSYAEEEFSALEQKQIAEHRKAEQSREKLREKLEKLEAAFLEIPDQILKLAKVMQQSDLEKQIRENQLEEYLRKEDRIRKICMEHNLDFEWRFTEQIADYLHAENRKKEADYSDVLRKIALHQDEIDAASRGYLHIPRAVIDYLNATGAAFTTCEKYLLDQVKAGQLPREDCLEILRNDPAAAYGVIMTAENRKRLFDFGREKWLPAMVPIFNYDQMDAILRLEQSDSGSIAFYSEEYFADTEHFIDHLDQAQTRLNETKTLLMAQRARLEEQIRTVEEFSYPETWREAQEAEIARLDQSIQNAKAETVHLEQEKNRIQNQKNKISGQMEQLLQTMQQIQNILDTLTRVRNRLEIEQSMHRQVYENRIRMEQAEQKVSQSRTQQNLCLQALEKAQRAADQAEVLQQELRQALREVAGLTAEKQIAGNWKDLLVQYQTRMKAAGQELEHLQAILAEKNKQISSYQNEIARRDLPETDYIDLLYSESERNHLDQRRKQAESDHQAAQQISLSAIRTEAGAKAKLEDAESALSEFGEPLAASEVGTDFANRIRAVSEDQGKCQSKLRGYEKQEQQTEREKSRLADYLADFEQPTQIPPVELKDDLKSQCSDAVEDHRSRRKYVLDQEADVRLQLQQLRMKDSAGLEEAASAMESLLALLNHPLRGDRYYTITDLVEGYMENASRAIAQIATDLKEFEHSRSDLVQQCKLQGRQIYEGLRQMAASSRVQVHNGKPKKQMLAFDFRDQVDPVVAEAAISDEIDQGTRDLVRLLEQEPASEMELRKRAERIVGSRNLLRKYIGREQIQVSAYKIDQNPENSGYRRWRDTQINNSGAEKFVVYFAVILSLMNYTRGSMDDLSDRELHSVLILDNPFGATSSRHILIPMFAIAKHFRVQMICLSDINKADVLNCFDIVIRAIVKQRPMSNREMLTHEGNEQIEHGFYRAEQMTLL